jgi:hypothetical protein
MSVVRSVCLNLDPSAANRAAGYFRPARAFIPVAKSLKLKKIVGHPESIYKGQPLL